MSTQKTPREVRGAPASLQVRSFPLAVEAPSALTVVEGISPLRAVPSPAIALGTSDPLEMQALLAYAGVAYRSPTCDAANLGVRLFAAARAFTLESAPEWVGFDWDFTTNYYKIYSPIVSLLLVKFLKKPPLAVLGKSIRFFEASKPGMYECILGMAVGYALRQGLRSFAQWEYYRPQVRWVTQTWPHRLALYGSNAIPLIPLMMGRLPGKSLSEDDIRRSDAFITVEDFVGYTRGLLDRFQRGGRLFYTLSAREQDEVIEVLRAGKGYKLKLMGAFTAKGWSPPELIFDDSPGSSAQFQREGVRVVNTHNVLAPGKEMNEVRALCFRGRRAAARQMIQVASQTEGPALIEVLRGLAAGNTSVALGQDHLSPVPDGSVVVLHDGTGRMCDMFSKFVVMQRDVNRLIKRILRDAGGLAKLEEQYRITSSQRRRREKEDCRLSEGVIARVAAGWQRMTARAQA